VLKLGESRKGVNDALIEVNIEEKDRVISALKKRSEHDEEPKA